jgi:hypothetical protein
VARLLLFADVRSRVAALDALLDAAKRGGDEPVCLGNLAEPGPGAQDTLELARRKGVMLVAGPLDKALLKEPVGIERAEVAWLRNAAAPRRLVAGGRAMLLTSDPAAQAPSFVVRPGAATRIAERHAELGPVAESRGEAACLRLDLETGALDARRVAWDQTAR